MTNTFIALETDKLEFLLEKIRTIILLKNDWIEKNEICEILALPNNTNLIDGMFNSKIGQLLYNYLRKEGYQYKKVILDENDKFNYEIWVAPPDPTADTINNKPKNKPVNNKEKINTEEAAEEEDNEQLNRIIELINKGENIFITGYAGTGKSYILNKLKNIFKIDVTSTTGLAAVNIQGQTIHSWAGVGICNKPVDRVVENILKRSSIKKQILNCKILAIDEISMLDARTMEYIDNVLRALRDDEMPFGGIQVLFFGDFFQLPPVEKESGFCFNSNCWKELNLKTVFLDKIYRQKDEKLIRALGNMRLNSLTEDDIELLQSREARHNTKDSDMLHIFSTNREADGYNNLKFNTITTPCYKFISTDKIHKKKQVLEVNDEKPDKGLFKIDLMTWEMFDKYCKAPHVLELKQGCKVMLLKNHNFTKGLINGSCGTVLSIDEKAILVKFDNGIEEKIPVHTFEYYRDGELAVSREQYPLRLAYGITIHKSQGMTLDRLVVDCNRIFECGQLYVAISRVKTLEGLHVKAFNPAKVLVNQNVIDFYDLLR